VKSDLDLNLSPKIFNGRISFHNADIIFSQKNKLATKIWLKNVANARGFSVSDIQYIFCSDEYLLDINRNFLQHDYFTDIITFDLSEKKGELYSEIYISIPRVKENAKDFGVTFQEELYRVMAHGVLHLCGLKDKTPQQEKKMREAEDQALLMRDF
jgi:probable rRNA maturation factor